MNLGVQQTFLLLKLTDISEALTHLPDDGGSSHLQRYLMPTFSTRVHGAIFQQLVIYMLADVKSENSTKIMASFD